MNRSPFTAAWLCSVLMAATWSACATVRPPPKPTRHPERARKTSSAPMSRSIPATTRGHAVRDVPGQTLAGVDPDDVREALALYAHEPSVAVVVQRALSAEGSANVADVAAAARRARRAGWVPEVRLSVRHGQAIDLADTQQADLGTRLKVSTDRDVTVSGVLTFDLAKVIYSPAEAGLYREQRAAQAARRKWISQLVALYFERRRLLLLRDLGLRDDVGLHIRVLEIEALLDAFTAGSFSSMIHAVSSR